MTSAHRRFPDPDPGSAGRGDAPRWRRRVRRITAGVAAAGGVGAIALTVGLAQAAPPVASAVPADDPAAGLAAPTSAAGPTSGATPTRPGAPPRTTPPLTTPPQTTQPRAVTPGTTAPAAPSAAAPAITAPPTVAPPMQAPAAGSGRSHARSGGS